MKPIEKVAVGLVSLLAIFCTITLFIPAIRDHEPGGIFAALNLPGWAFLGAGIFFGVGFVVMKVVNVGRLKRGRRPL